MPSDAEPSDAEPSDAEPSDAEMDSSAALTVDDEQFTPTRQPEVPRNRATNRPPIAPALHHTTFTTKRLDEMVAWYERAVGLVPVFYGQDAASRAGEYLPEEIPQDIFLPELY
jgi:hypothetical protein